MGVSFTFLVVVVVALVGCIWWVLRGRGESATTLSSLGASSPRRSTSSESVQGFHWPGTGDFEFEVVGESFYQKDLARLAGAHGEQSADVQCVATLVLEDDNKHDPKAVAVLVDGRKIAHPSREDARSFRRRLGAKKLSGARTTCDALIVGGGTRRNGEKLMYGAKLDIKPFE